MGCDAARNRHWPVGNHTAEGWAIVIPGASRMRELGRDPRLTDIAATAAHLSGADASGLPGEPLLDPPSASPEH